ncbi:MAG: excinuclease ABC subunit UvrC [Candidatus Omnitrophica bacterium]|nr:excinuclease ABC subunit UvrC [Candidatus Omnitrophota bacterium]
MSSLREKIAKMPDSPGVYLMKDSAGKIIYVGKAKSLRKRLMTYLGRDLATKTLIQMRSVADIQVQLCPTEALALLLEAALIHKHMPKYNISLRDDKSFPLIKITKEDFPAIYVTRKKEDDGSRYLGPYTSANLLREALKIIRRSFPIRSCRNLPDKACLYYRVNLCPGPCIGKISKKDYALAIENISLILEGKTDTLINKLSIEMKRFSENKEFEQAAAARDQISAISALSSIRPGFSSSDEMQDLKNLLKLSKIPERIECFDIANICGKEATGSMVSFHKGKPDKNNYRRFKIKAVNAIDDYAMMQEVVRRRYARVIEQKLPKPDLILIDGGKGHLMTAAKVLLDFGLPIPLASIAKEEENIYLLGKVNPIQLKSDTPALNLIRRVRDEAHRFAQAYHHLLHRKKVIGR